MLAAVVLLITTIIFGLMALAPNSAPIKTENVRRAAQSDTEAEIKEVAERFTENLLTYNYQTVDANFREALEDSTPDFATRPLGAFGGANIDAAKAESKSNQSTSNADVKGVAVTSRDDDRATVLVVTYRTFSAKKTTANASGLLVIELSMTNTGDGWKIDNAANPAAAN